MTRPNLLAWIFTVALAGVFTSALHAAEDQIAPATVATPTAQTAPTAQATPTAVATPTATATPTAKATPTATATPTLVEASPLAPSAKSTSKVDDLVAVFNPDLFAVDANRHPVTPMVNMFTHPASDIAREVVGNTWFNFAIFLPFLVLPEVMLLYVIWKFRARGDGRKSATFMGNHALEIMWTAIPCLALIVVSVPVWHVLWKMELPPANQKDALNIEVRGKQFAWDYKYQDHQLSIGQDVTGFQEPLVLEKGKTTILNITSNDVNHAWWVPAFGVKKDAIIGRYTYTWFTPETEGLFKGQCAELCGQSHGIMIISSVVVSPERFADYLAVQHHRNDTLKTWNQLAPSVNDIDQSTLDQAVISYFAKSHSAERQLALRYWIATNYASCARRRQMGLSKDDVIARGAQRRILLDRAIDRVLAVAVK